MLYAHRLVSGACVGAEKKCQTHYLMFSLKEKERFIDKNKEFFSMSLIMPPLKNKNIFLFQNLDGT